VANGVVYVGSDDDGLYALNAANGTLLWSYTTGGAVESSPAVANGVVYVGSGDDNLYAFGLPGGTKNDVRRPGPASLRPNQHTDQNWHI
jgi:outer membrane protein assembly factor BamB